MEGGQHSRKQKEKRINRCIKYQEIYKKEIKKVWEMALSWCHIYGPIL